MNVSRQMTKGEYRVGINFNPSADSAVDRIKRAAADFIDMIDEYSAGGGSSPEKVGETNRLKALAQTHVEDAAMWAVKAVTKGER